MGLTPIKNKRDKWGYKDENGKIVIPCIYESVTTFNCSIALVLKNNEWRLIDEEGNLIPKSKYDYVEE